MLSRQGKSIPTWHNTFPDSRRAAEIRSVMAVVITDITERKQAEEALRQSHDELQAIYDRDRWMASSLWTSRHAESHSGERRILSDAGLHRRGTRGRSRQNEFIRPKDCPKI